MEDIKVKYSLQCNTFTFHVLEREYKNTGQGTKMTKKTCIDDLLSL